MFFCCFCFLVLFQMASLSETRGPRGNSVCTYFYKGAAVCSLQIEITCQCIKLCDLCHTKKEESIKGMESIDKQTNISRRTLSNSDFSPKDNILMKCTNHAETINKFAVEHFS